MGMGQDAYDQISQPTTRPTLAKLDESDNLFTFICESSGYLLSFNFVMTSVTMVFTLKALMCIPTSFLAPVSTSLPLSLVCCGFWIAKMGSEIVLPSKAYLMFSYSLTESWKAKSLRRNLQSLADFASFFNI